MASTTDPKYLIAVVCISELDKFFKQVAAHTPVIDLLNGNINIKSYNPNIKIVDQLTYLHNSYIIDIDMPKSQIFIRAHEIEYLNIIYQIDYDYEVYFDKELLFSSINDKLSEILTSIGKAIVMLFLNLEKK